ncbi:aromatic motif membrane protein [Mycoplasma sp. CSL7503-lung]|uniref:aromatic motif membrane protein n=1 Tax=Mycoplasma sp. CSL7503-lung TaxID=536372 RepID=UPI0021D2A12B|nr:aromatic motif membrane protein [Mycoplasma sp. CSL7503-lung]MCU4706697.1 hypothetical protein [Mycoplasma sp. CSL7503-lung]
MKKSKILKIFFSSFVFTVPLLMSLSCSNRTNDAKKLESIQNSIEKNDENKEWENFINQKYIKLILDRSFNSKEEIQKYIQNQQSIKEKYFDDIKIASRFGNNIISDFDDDSSFFSNGKNYITDKSADIKEELYSKNWLFFLFNINRFNFFHFSDIEPDKAFKEDFIEGLETNKKIFKDFYNPKKLQIIDAAIQEYDLRELSVKNFEENEENSNSSKYKTKETTYKYEDRIYFLSGEGYIYFVRVFGTKKVTKYNNNETFESKNVDRVYLNQYLYSFPKLILSNDKLNDFDLKKYIDTVAPWESSKIKPSDAKRTLFVEEYGGETFRYTLIDVI